MADEATTETAADESTAGSTENQATAAEPAADDEVAKLRKVNADLERKLKRSEDNRARVSDLESQLADMIAKSQGKEQERAAELESQRVRDEVQSAANQRILKAEVRAAAAGKLADPQDALRFLDLSEFEVGSDGEVDGDAVAAAITDLISKKPYLSVKDGRRFQGDADGGARKEPPAKTVDEQIAEAEKSGDWRAASKLKAAQLLKPSTT